jgi:hypothetical protein
MKTDQPYQSAPVFLQSVSVAIAQLKERLQRDYEQTYPGLREIISLVLDAEEARAWRLTLFPHLLLPDLVEVHIASLNLEAVETKHLFASRHPEIETNQPVFALCG